MIQVKNGKLKIVGNPINCETEFLQLLSIYHIFRKKHEVISKFYAELSASKVKTVSKYFLEFSEIAFKAIKEELEEVRDEN